MTAGSRPPRPGASLHSMTDRREDEPSDDAPRVRDLPGPRVTKGIAGPAMRFVFAWPYRVGLAGLYRARVRPWQLTLASLATNVVIGWLLLTGRRFLPGLLLILAGVFDIFDGAVARLRGEESRFGAFLDSFLDRVSDVTLFGCLFWSLSGMGERLEAGLSLATLVVSLAVSHVRAEAEAAGVQLTEGFFQRLERYVAMVIGLMVRGALLPMLVALAALGGATVLQRGWSAVRRAA